MAPIKRKTLNKHKRKVKSKFHTISTQVTHRDLDDTFEMMCDDPQTSFSIYKRQLLKRKKQKYRNLLVAGSIAKISSEILKQSVPYSVGPQTIYKNTRRLY